jgi:hypothetical protein
MKMKPFFDYEQIIFQSLVALNGNKHIWIKKATGLGISELMLRFMAWLCLKDKALSGSQMCIVTGPRIDLEWVDGIVQIMRAEEYRRPDYNEMLSLVYGLMSKYQVDKVYIDDANPSFIKSLKIQIGEEADYDKVIARYRSEG